jgi:hypothetical protein
VAAGRRERGRVAVILAVNELVLVVAGVFCWVVFASAILIWVQHQKDRERYW